MGVAVGSATQVSMFVVPVAVLSGWIMVRFGGGGVKGRVGQKLLFSCNAYQE